MDNPHALFREVIAATGDRIAAEIRAIRERFGLDLRSAKEVMHQAEGTAASLDEHQARLVEGLKRPSANTARADDSARSASG